ncbi:hypothetical protein EWM64_g10070 [Hericium alpestre]|uniref:SnoaL-like domain-containing protein n=1 Tax=Hericium alpestre TaxID=135208 RepID=A0A4Y9ZJ80_9AGAM|nr:hypothetical protein EWM64_g10070 [Hericium alpestre]
MSPSRTQLLNAFQSFTDALGTGQDLDTLLSHFSTSTEPEVIEHGLPVLAPFLGRRFVGRTGARQYFTLLNSLLALKEMSYSGHIVDPTVCKVSAIGKGMWTWKNTGQTWSETFMVMLDFDEELKITRYQICADSGAAYLASRGELRDEEVSHQLFVPLWWLQYANRNSRLFERKRIHYLICNGKQFRGDSTLRLMRSSELRASVSCPSTKYFFQGG